MLKTPASKAQIAALAAAFWLSMPVFDTAFYTLRQASGAYPTHADTIAIPIYAGAIAWLAATPVFALLAWLVIRTYQGGLKFWAWDTTRPWRSVLASVFWGGLAAACAYSTLESAVSLNWVDAVSFLPWVYLFLCLRSSAAGTAPSAPKKRRVLLLLVYVEASNYAVAGKMQHQIQDELLRLGITAKLTSSEPYWKIPAYHGLNWQLQGNAQAAFDSIVSLVSNGWTFEGDADEPEAVWNFAADAAPLFAPEMRWAHLQIVDINP